MSKKSYLRVTFLITALILLSAIIFLGNTYYNAINGMREFSALWNTTDSIIYYIKKNDEWPDSFESLSEAYSIYAHPFKREDLSYFQNNVEIIFHVDLGKMPESDDWYVHLKKGELPQDEKDANDRIRSTIRDLHLSR